MATLTKTESVDTSDSEYAPELPPGLAESIPQPFQREQLDALAQPEQSQEASSHTDLNQELHPSVSLVQRSCLITLNNLLSDQSTDWQAIVPDRRHSMPHASPTTFTNTSTPPSTSSALKTLLTNLRNNDNAQMIEAKQDLSDSQMLAELDSRIHKLSLSPPDVALATSIISLLQNFERLASLGVSSSSAQYFPPPPSDNDLVSALRHFQATTSSQTLEGARTPVQQVESALLWSNVEHQLENVATMCKERNHAATFTNLPPHYADHFPEYDQDILDGDEELPEYEYSRPSMSLEGADEKTKASLHSVHHPSAADEKTRLDLEAVAMAIDRLYMVAPQLSNQRVELREGKRAEMEKASRSKATGAKGKGKAKQNDFKELESMLELLGKASERTYKDQSFILDANEMAKRLERAKLRDDAKKAEFISTLAMHSSAGRFHNQDSLPPSSSSHLRERDPEAMLTLPEFIREALPKEIEQKREDERMMTLPEFVREPPPPHLTDSIEEPEKESGGTRVASSSKRSASDLNRIRSKSLSSVSFPWLKRSHSSAVDASTSTTTSASSNEETPPIPSSSGPRKLTSRSRSALHLNHHKRNSSTVFRTIHLAEAHHSLRHVLVFLRLDGNRKEAGGEVIGEVCTGERGLSDGTDWEKGGGKELVIKYGSQTGDPPIRLPARCVLGSEQVKVKVMSMGTWFELRVGMAPGGDEQGRGGGDEEPGLMDAHQLGLSEPTSFICSSCSLPLVSFSSPASSTTTIPSPLIKYRDLPSSHWEELVDSWMCHSSQKLNEQIVQRSKEGFVPGNEEVLVGKSFFLLDEAWVVAGNVKVADAKVGRFFSFPYLPPDDQEDQHRLLTPHFTGLLPTLAFSNPVLMNVSVH